MHAWSEKYFLKSHLENTKETRLGFILHISSNMGDEGLKGIAAGKSLAGMEE